MKRLGIIISGLLGVVIASSASALPFNNDMADMQIKTGQISRPRPEGAVALGTLEKGDYKFKLEKKEDAASFTNPKKGNPVAIANGKRLFAINCSPCHGNMEKVPYEAGVAGRLIGAPDLTMPLYKERSDGSLYGTIHLGGMAIMPAYGWKLSPSEHWDIISYVRKIQASR